jgi:hypothetical protein
MVDGKRKISNPDTDSDIHQFDRQLPEKSKTDMNCFHTFGRPFVSTFLQVYCYVVSERVVIRRALDKP